MHAGLDHLAQVVRRDAGGHADGDALGAVDQQVGEAGRQHDRFGAGGVVIEPRVDGVVAEFGHQLFGDRREPGLGVAGRGGPHAHHRAEVALAVDQGVAEREVLGHPHQGLVDGHLTVGMVVADGVAADLHRLPRLGGGREMQVMVHRVQDATLDRLESIAYVGQCARRYY